MRKKLIAANWKMNAPPPGWDGEDSPYRTRDTVDVVVFPTFLDIHTCVEHFLVTGGQYGRAEEKGAYTGDISMQLLAGHGCAYVLCGHSERRMHHGETDASIATQMEAAIKAGLHPILCVGETAEERASGKAQDIVQRQLSFLNDPTFSIFHFPFSIAYEPIWAIGNGQTARPEDAQTMHAFVRSLLPESIRSDVRIIYGGSVRPDNAADLFAAPDIDGALIGASSLDPSSFRAILDLLPL